MAGCLLQVSSTSCVHLPIRAVHICSEQHCTIKSTCMCSWCSSLYFDNQLGACSVEWSTKRMTL